MRRVAVFAVLFFVVLALPVVSHATIYLDTNIDELYNSSSLHPGRAYYFPLMFNNHQIEQGENTGYTCRVTVDPRGAGVSASIVTEGGFQWVRVSLSGTAGRDDDFVDVVLNITNRSDRYDTWEDPYTFEIGYGNTYFCAEDELDIFEGETVIEFADSVTTCFIYLPDGSEFIASLVPNTSKNIQEGVNRIIDFHSTSNMIYDIETKYGITAVLEYLRFYTGVTFNQSLLRIYAPTQSYVYSVDSSNNLTRLQAVRNGDFLVISVTTLGSYVTSNRDLGIPYGSSSADDDDGSSSSQGSIQPPAPLPVPSRYPPATGGESGNKLNPATGAVC